MKTYTDRFERVLPDSLRCRYRVPHGTAVPYISPKPLVASKPAAPEKKTPWVLLAWSALVMVIGGIFLVTYEQVIQEAKGSNTWPPGHVYARDLLTAATVRPTPIPIPTPEPVVGPIPTPSPVPAPEVRRAEPVKREPDYFEADMPDGRVMLAEMLGSVARQEDLPLTGNKTGDAYAVAGIPFVWTQLANGQGVWIDPQIIP